MKKLKLFSLALMAMFSMSAWAANVELDTLVNIDFKASIWSGKTFTQGNTTKSDTINDIFFYCKDSSKKFSLADNTTKGLTFPGSNMSSGNNYFCIPLTNINKKISVTLKHSYNSNKASYKYAFADGRTEYIPGNTNSSSGTQVTDNANADTEILFDVNANNTAGHLFIARSSSSYEKILGVIVTTPKASGKEDPELSVSPTSVTLAKSGTQQLTATQSGDGTISYESSNTSVATVSSTGLITAVGNGSATITVTSAETSGYDEGSVTVDVVVKDNLNIIKYAKFNNALTCSPTGFVTIENGSYNTAYPGKYNDETYTKGLKLQNSTIVNFTTFCTSCDLIVVQSIKSNTNIIKIDDTEFVTNYDTKYYYDNTADNVRVYVIKGFSSGAHTIKRGTSGESGILYVGVTEALSVSPSTASDFTYFVGNGPSAAQAFTVTGIGLAEDEITASLNAGSEYYEISSDNTTYGTSNLTVASGDVVYVRLKSNLSLGDAYAGTLRFVANSGADNANITLAGSVTNPTYSVTYNLNGGEGDTPTESTQESGAKITLAAAPSRTYYTFAGWKCNIDGVVYNANDTYTMTAAATTFTAQWTGLYTIGSYVFENHATVGTNPSKEVSTSKTSYTAFRVDNIYFDGMDIQYEAGEYSGSGDDFKGWKIKSASKNIRFLVENNSQVTVQMGNLTSDCNITYTPITGEEKSVALAAKTANKYNVKAGTLVTLTTQGSETVTLKQIAVAPFYDIAIYDGITNGSVEASPSSAIAGTEITLSNEPAPGHQFVTYSVYKTGDQTTTVSVSEGTFKMPAYPVTVSATFSAIPYTITIDKDIENGSVVAEVNEEVAENATIGQTVVLTVTANESYKVGTVKYNDGTDHVITPVNDVYSFTMPAHAVTVSATFEEDSASGINDVENEAKAVKRLENGMLIIEKNGHLYNVLGGLIK